MSDVVNTAKRDMALECLNVARCLTYNDSSHQSTAKHLLLEAAHALDTSNVRVVKSGFSRMIRNSRGKSRHMTIRERIACWLLKGKTEIRA